MKTNKIIVLILLFTLICVYCSITTVFSAKTNIQINSNIEIIKSEQSDNKKIDYDFDTDPNVINLSNTTIQLENINYIYNSIYFKCYPYRATHKEENNPIGTCTTIAMQILLGYHNYYSDRRLIPEFDSEGNAFLEDDFGDIEYNPELIYPGFINTDYSDYLGTCDNLYDTLIKMNTTLDEINLEQNVFTIANVGSRFVDEYSTCDPSDINITGGFYNENEAIQEIENNNPIILGMQLIGNGTEQISFHVVVAYGYAYYNGALGYIVDFGWGSNYSFMWVPASYFTYKIKMNVNHIHNYITKNKREDIYGNEIYYEKECVECGCVLSDCLFEMNSNGDKLLGVKYEYDEDLYIPEDIRGVELKYIGNSAFKGLSCLESISLPSTILEIEESAFENCENLSSVEFNNNENLDIINEATFKNCINLVSLIIPNNIKKIDKFSFQGCSKLKNIIHSGDLLEIDNCAFQYCTSLEKMNFKDSINRIGISAFEGCTSLGDLRFPQSLDSIGSSAFKGCSNIAKIIVSKDKGNIISLGSDAFEGCTKLISIVIPENKVIKYKNASNWYTYRDKILPPISYGEEYIDCKYQGIFKDLDIESGYDNIVQITSGCSKTYKFIFNAENAIDVKITNAYYIILISEINYKNDHKTVEMTVHLTKGIYYFDVFYVSNNDSGKVTINHQVVYPVEAYSASMGNNDVLLHLHENVLGKKENMLKLDSYDFGMYSFKLIACVNDIEVEIPSGAISIYDDAQKNFIIPQYYPLNNGVVAVSNTDLLYVYINNNGPIYINVELEFKQYSSVLLIIEKLALDEFDLFNYDALTDVSLIEETNIVYNEFFKKVNLKQDWKFRTFLSGFTQGFLIIAEEFDISNNEKDIRLKIKEPLTTISSDFILEKGIYYIGYIEAQFNFNNFFQIKSIINDTHGISIYQNGGTEVTINKGDNNSNTITQGFTRLLFLTSGESRLDYYWYTNNEKVSRITEVGTLMGLNVTSDTEIKIMAINKLDPSIVVCERYVIKKEENTNVFPILELDEPIIFSLSKDERVQIDISSLDVPINWLQYYEWTSSNNNIKVDQFGRITVENNVHFSTYSIRGDYKLNSRFIIMINITIVE